MSDPASVAAAAERAQAVTVLIDNAGAPLNANFLDSPVDDLRREFETNFYGPLSWIGLAGSYGASRAAFWSQANFLRLDPKPRGIDVTGLHVGYVDTDMTAGIDALKSTPDGVAAQALDGIESGAFEVLAEDLSRQVKAGLAAGVEVLYPQLTA